ncbi:MAG: hypothetical protein KC420_22295, partial [Myxococcales bacterium]|nr:hypothetical protein [Myxococcales bacterium]
EEYEALVDTWVSKRDPVGEVIWEQRHDEQGGNDIAHGVAVDGDGNVIVVGEQFVVGEGANIWIAKYTAEGDQLWTKTYIGEGTLGDIARGVAVDPQGDYVVVGQLAVKGEDTNFWVAKLDPAGNELWSDIYNGPSDLGDSARGVAVDSDGNIWAVGDEYKLIGLANIVVRKYDPAGTLLFSDVYDHKAGIDRAHGVAILSDDSAVVVGEIYEPIGLADLWIRRYTAAGSELWTKSWDNKAGNDIIRAVAVDGEDHIF